MQTSSLAATSSASLVARCPRPRERRVLCAHAALPAPSAAGGARRRVAIQPSGADYTDAEPHVLRDGHGFVEGGITFLVAFWSVRGHMAQQKPPERAADGGPALRPLPWRIMDRSAYTWRVFGAMFMLLLDVGVNTFSDSVHWRTAFGDGETVADLIASIALFVIAVAIRVLFAICFFLLLVNTAHFRLGRYAELSRDFGGALVVTLLSFGSSSRCAPYASSAAR